MLQLTQPHELSGEKNNPRHKPTGITAFSLATIPMVMTPLSPARGLRFARGLPHSPQAQSASRVRLGSGMEAASSGVGEVIVEITRSGSYLKCCAVHVATGVEAVAIGPAHEPKAVERIAIGKLKRALAAR